MGAQPDREFFVVQAEKEIRDRINRDAGFKPKRVQELLGIFAENFLDPDFDIGVAARKYGSGGRYAAEQMANKLGIAPGAYLNRCRMDFAKILLRRSALKIWRIASASGFSSQSHFSRSFSSSVGMSPTVYRRRSRTLRGDLAGATEMDPVEFLERLYLGSLEPEVVRLHWDQVREANRRAFPHPDPPPNDLPEATARPTAERILEPLICALISKSNILGYQAEHSSAIATLAEATDLLTQDRGPLLRFAVHANRATNLAWLGRFEESISALEEAEAACEEIENTRLFRFQLVWTKGLAEQGLGRAAQGRELLLEARRRFIDLGETEHASVISLDLAIRWLETGEYAAARGILLETLPVFQALKNPEELCVSWRLLEEACRAEALELKILRQLRSQIEKLRLDPARIHNLKQD